MRIIITIWILKRETMTGWMKTSLMREAAGPAYIIALSRRTRLMKIKSKNESVASVDVTLYGCRQPLE